MAARNPQPRRIALAAGILIGWFITLAIWIFAGGGFGMIRDTPYLGIPIMIMGGMAVQVLCMSLVGWPRRQERRGETLN